MIGGVSFQPQQPGEGMGTKPKSNSVQEAIKILSLRLPKTVGAQAIAPGALMNAQGSGGNPRIDSVVNQVMGRMFPTGAPGPAAPVAPVLGPSAGENGTMPVSPPVRFDGNTRPPDHTPLSSMMPSAEMPIRRPSQAPRIVADNAPTGDFMVGAPSPGGDYGQPPATLDIANPWAELEALLRRQQGPMDSEQPPSI